MERSLTPYRASLTIPRDAEPDVVVRVGRRIVQIERQNTCVGVVVPVAAADEAAEPPH
jgi:hypothetical protein